MGTHKCQLLLLKKLKHGKESKYKVSLLFVSFTHLTGISFMKRLHLHEYKYEYSVLDSEQISTSSHVLQDKYGSMCCRETSMTNKWNNLTYKLARYEATLFGVRTMFVSISPQQSNMYEKKLLDLCQRHTAFIVTERPSGHTSST